MANKIKKILISCILIVLLLVFGIIFYYNSNDSIYIITDSIFYETTIKYQKMELKYNALLNNKKIEFIIDDKTNGDWIDYEYEKDSIIIVSPYISMLMDYDKDINFDNNYLISIDYELDRADINVAVDYLSGYEQLARTLKNEKKNVFLISSKDWPSSVSKAIAFESEFTNEGLTKIALIGNELEQKAYDIVEKINKEENVEVVSTGCSLIPYFSNVENNISYNFEAYQSYSVDKNFLHYVIYEDLTKLINIDHSSSRIVLNTKLENNQEGILNFFLHLLRDLESQLF